ncbi:MAG: ATP-binding protein [Pseudomonadota bacterium]
MSQNDLSSNDRTLLLQGAAARFSGLNAAIVGCALLLLALGVDWQVVFVGVGAFSVGFGAVLLATYKTGPFASAYLSSAGRAKPKAKTESLPEDVNRDVAQGMAELFDGLPVALLRIEPSGRVSQSNAAARQMLKLVPGEEPMFENLVEELGRSVSSWVQMARESHGSHKAEIVHAARRRGEAVLQVSLLASPLAGDRSLVAVLTDTTELKTMEAQFLQSQKMQAVGQLAGGVAHDFNNLLTAISGYCDLLLLRHGKDDPDYSDLLQISQNANRAASLVAHLLAFSRKQTLTPKVVDVNDTISDIGHLLSRLLGEKVTLFADYGKALPKAFVDPRQLEQVIMNLVLNARDAMEDGGEVRLTSDLTVYAENSVIDGVTVPRGRYVTIRVTDEGVGMTPEVKAQIFDPFFSTKEEGKGTGLGLSMVYGIVKQTGGFIFCDATMGKGTEFRVLLPAHEVEEVAPQAPTAARHSPAELSGLNLLLVEDEAPVRSFAARALKMHGVQVIEADSAEAALEILADDAVDFDIVVSDVVMPGLDGPTWIKEARRDRPNLKVIFVSGYAEEDFSKEYPDIKKAAFLPKPFTLKDLVNKVRDLSGN